MIDFSLVPLSGSVNAKKPKFYGRIHPSSRERVGQKQRYLLLI